MHTLKNFSHRKSPLTRVCWTWSGWMSDSTVVLSHDCMRSPGAHDQRALRAELGQHARLDLSSHTCSLWLAQFKEAKFSTRLIIFSYLFHSYVIEKCLYNKSDCRCWALWLFLNDIWSMIVDHVRPWTGGIYTHLQCTDDTTLVESRTVGRLGGHTRKHRKEGEVSVWGEQRVIVSWN